MGHWPMGIAWERWNPSWSVILSIILIHFFILPLLHLRLFDWLLIGLDNSSIFFLHLHFGTFACYYWQVFYCFIELCFVCYCYCNCQVFIADYFIELSRLTSLLPGSASSLVTVNLPALEILAPNYHYVFHYYHHHYHYYPHHHHHHHQSNISILQFIYK